MPTFCAAQCSQGIRKGKEGGGLAGFNNSGSLQSFLVNFSMFWFRELILLSIKTQNLSLNLMVIKSLLLVCNIFI